MIIYTRTICPKCMNVKFTLGNIEGALEKVEFVNLDDHPEIADELSKGESTKNLTSIPILKYGEDLYTNDQSQIIQIVAEA